MMKAHVALLLVAACTGESQPSFDAPSGDDLAGWPTLGKDGQAAFNLELGSCDRAIAQRADADVGAVVRHTAPEIATVTSDDPTILAVTTAEPFSPTTVDVKVHAAGAGDVDLVLRDAGGVEIDRATFHVRPTDDLGIPRPWGDGNALVMTGAVQRMHATTKTAGVVTAGLGAPKFTLAGDLSPATHDDAPYFDDEGDQLFVRAGAPGAASIVVDAPDTTTTIPVTIVGPSDLTGIAQSATYIDMTVHDVAAVHIGALVGSAGVYGAQCAWSPEPGLMIDLPRYFTTSYDPQTGWLGVESRFVYTIEGLQAGTYHETCTMPGGLQAAITVNVRP